MQNELNLGDRVICEKGKNKSKRGTVSGYSYGNKRIDVDFEDSTQAVNSLQSKYRKL